MPQLKSLRLLLPIREILLKMNSKLISIIVPIYNVEEYLGKCLDSIINQTYENLEIILVDDGSPDSCPAICDEYAAKDSRIKVIHKENGGVSSARNAGLDAATGEYIGWVDPDDIAEKNMFEVLLKALNENKSDISVCGVKKFQMESKEEFHSPQTVDGKTFLKLLLKEDEKSYLWNKLYKRELFSDIRFPEGEIFEDMKILHLIAEKAQTAVFTDKTFYNYRIREKSITTVNKGLRALQFYDAAHGRSERYKDTEFYIYALVGEFRCLRIIVSEAKNSERKEEHYRKYIKLSKELYKKCRSEIHGFQKILSAVFVVSPRLYSFIRNTYKKTQ